MILHPGRWIKVKIKGLIYRGIIAEVYESKVEVMIRSPDNLLTRFSVPIEDILL